MIDDRLAAAELLVRHGPLVLAHRDGRLEQEAQGAVVEHDHQALGRRGEDGLLLVCGG